MKFEYGLKSNPNEEIPSDYLKVESINLIYRFALGIVIGIIISAILSLVIDLFFYKDTLDFSITRYLYLILIIIPIHEAVHVIFLPKPSEAIVGLSIKHFIFYVKYDGLISKRRFLYISIMPFMILSILPIMILPFIKSIYIVNSILINTLASGVDLLSFFIVLKLPEGIILKMSDNDLFYKKG